MPNIKEKKTSQKTILRIALLCSHDQVHPFGTFESFQADFAHFPPVSLYALKEGRVHSLVRLVIN